MKRIVLSIFLFQLILTSTVFAQERDPVGEQAYYKVDTDRNRTSSMIRSGDLTAVVKPGFEQGDQLIYPVSLNYKFKILFMGTQTGQEIINFEQEVFTEQFLIDLRENGHYESSGFKAEHLGFADAHNLDGRTYENCDKVRFYDITNYQDIKLVRMMRYFFYRSLLEQGVSVSPETEIEDLELITLIQYGLPVLGAAKVDMTGKYQGHNVKVGADYLP